VEHSARVRLTRLRWRMRGAWLWPAFFALCAVDGILIAMLPPFDGAPEDVVGGVLMAGFANLAALALVGPPAARALRRRRPDLPRVVAYDYAGTALVLALGVVVLALGLLHRPAVVAERGDEDAMFSAVQQYVGAHAASWQPGLGAIDAVQLAPDVYRACVPGDDPRRSLCLIVDTDRRPARVVRDDSMQPN
jgi:4-amino-4-deoxy-L-arabinose transferase-like glycosyltransferase